MPLFTTRIDEARVAYSALELRTTSAELRTSALQSQVDDLKARQPLAFEQAKFLRQSAVDRAAENAELRTQQITQVSPDASLQGFINAMALAVAVGEAAMPDRTVPSLTVSLQTYLTLDGGQINLRPHQPEFGASLGLSTATFQLARVPNPGGSAAPRNLYKVLEDVQSIYSQPFWSPFTQGTPAAPVAPNLVLAVFQLLGATSQWTFPFLVQSISTLAGMMKTLAAGALQSAPGAAATAHSASVDALVNLAAALGAKSGPVTGDLMALISALDAALSTARLLLP